MKKKKTLKEENNKMIISFVIINLVLGYLFLYMNDPNIDNINDFYKSIISKKSIFYLITPFIALVLTNLLSSNFKAKLVFLRFRDPLPGSRAFSKYLYKDVRIDVANIKDKHNPLPEKANEQNALWYSIFKKYPDNTMIVGSHKNFLLLRDLSCVSVLLFIIFSIVWMLSSGLFINPFNYFVYLLLQFITLNICANNQGCRFTCNVLAHESLN